jgi:spore coat polysaccharide biosynthesis protein SpsF
MSSPRVPAIIQARLSSSRLPGKVLLELGPSTVLEQVIEATRRFADPVVVATSTESSDDRLASFLAERGVLWVRGSLHDVASRFETALARPELDAPAWFFRVTADCPVVSEPLAQLLLAARSPERDVLYFEDSALPRGIAPELVRTAAFLDLQAKDLTAVEREHVTLGLYRRRPERAWALPIPDVYRHPEFRLTLDYAEDYRLFAELFARAPGLTAETALALLRADGRIAALNQHRQTAVP